MAKKVSKKHQRLSPKARKLIKDTKKKFAHDPKKAIKYLRSKHPLRFNIYDRRKIGREILTRMNLEWENLAPYKVEMLKEDYGLTEAKDNLEGLKEKSNYMKEGNLDYKEGIDAEKKGDNYDAYNNFANATEDYIQGEFHDKASLSLEKAYKNFNIYLKEADKERVDRIREGLRERTNNDSRRGVWISDQRKRLRTLDNKLEEESEKSPAMGIVLAIAGIGAGLFFLSNNITGNVVGNLTQNSSNWIGSIVIVLGLIAGFIYIKRR